VPGQFTLLARAKDANGNVQPDEHDPNNDSYVINYPVPIEGHADGRALVRQVVGWKILF
jgi:hypothetical protein